jgi:hypothetical protein
VLPNGAFLGLPMVPFSRARVFLRTPRDGTGRRDDEKFTLSARDVIRLIKNPPNIGVRGRRTGGSWVVFDADELHSVLRARLGRERPRRGVRSLPARYVTVDTGGTQATVAVFPRRTAWRIWRRRTRRTGSRC